MKLVAENGKYKLWHDPARDCKFILRFAKPEDPRHCIAELSKTFSKQLKSLFTDDQVRRALAKVHGMKYTAKKYKKLKSA